MLIFMTRIMKITDEEYTVTYLYNLLYFLFDIYKVI